MPKKIYSTTLLAGEKSGNLEEVLARYISFQRLAISFKKKLKASLVYPALLISLVIIMLSFLVTYVVPQFADLYTTLNAQLPPMTVFMLGVGAGARHYAVLIVLGIAGLAMIPLGLPGLWVMVGGILAFGWLTGFRTVGVATIAIVLGLAFLGEIIENWIGFRYAKRYGGSTRSGWGALIGGLVGAVIGVPVAVIGSVIGAFIGSFLGAALFEYTYSWHTGVATRAGWGAVVGRAAGAAIKIALGLIIAVVGLLAALS